MNGVELRVGASPASFPAQAELCRATIGVLASAGAHAMQQCNLPTPSAARQALVTKKIDLYWDSVDAAAQSYLHQTTLITNPETEYHDVAATDLRLHGITWLTPAPLTVSPQFVTAQDDTLAVHSLSEYASLARTDPSEATTCLTAAFESDADGWALLEKTYGFTLPASDTTIVPASHLVTDVTHKQLCRFGETTAVTGEPAGSRHVAVLHDDQHLFTPSHLALTMREETARRYPGLTHLLGTLTHDVTSAAVHSMTTSIMTEHLTTQTAAEQWLQSVGLVS